ncbi:MAG: tetratricopeptide repeat protein [Saprospirales bacterium]|nr:tetratricopeptide repeat protein [Saprospirales bacterium]
MKNLLLVVFLLIGVMASAQTLRTLKKRESTYAVVIGISDYQDPEIKDLNFAHRDAEIFAEFIRSKAGGSLGLQQIQLLTNQQATMAGIQSALDWLLKKAKKGDRAIVYFSGHGDVETLSEQEKGYLLAYDTPKNNYRLNAIDLAYFNESIIGELSHQGVKVIVITDACHSGSLAGEGIGGREATALELMKRFSSEVKIMSCQPYELSQEATKWGKGRGVFSYYLVDGLKGRADKDHDRRVDLYELEDFLQDRIRLATNKTQHPDIFGGRKEESIFLVDEATAEDLKAIEKAEIQRDFENEILSELATEQGALRYENFSAALKTGNLISPGDSSAVYYYEALLTDTIFRPLIGILAERLTTALLDSVQQAINAYLKTDPLELAQRDRFDQKYARFPVYLQKAAEILTPKDPRYRQALAKQFYFEGLALRLEAERLNGNDSLYRLALERQQKALEQEGRAAYIHNEIGFLLLELDQADGGMLHLQQAVELSPTWAIPHNNLAIGYHESDSLEQAKYYYRQAIRFKSDFASAYANLGNLFDEQLEADSAAVMYGKAIELNPADKSNYYNLGVFLSGQEGRQTEAEAAYRQALQLDPDYLKAWLGLGILYEALKQPDSAEHSYRQALELNPEFGEACQKLGNLYYHTGRKESAEKMLLDAIRINPDLDQIVEQLALVLIDLDRWEQTASLPLDTLQKLFVLYETGAVFARSQNIGMALKACRLAADIKPAEPYTDYLLCFYHVQLGQNKEALDHLEKTLEKALATAEADAYYELVSTTAELEPLRQSDRYTEIINRFFPDRQ